MNCKECFECKGLDCAILAQQEKDDIATDRQMEATKNHYGDGTCYYNGVFDCTGCGKCD